MTAGISKYLHVFFCSLNIHTVCIFAENVRKQRERNKAMLSPIAKRVDHIMIRVTESAYDQLFSLLTETLQLPLSWPINDSTPGFKTGGVFAGNINMEIFQSGTQQRLLSPEPSQAQFYGIAFEPYDLVTAVREVDKRGMAHLPLVPVPEGYPSGTMGSMWTLLFFGNLLGCDLSQYEVVMKDAKDLSPFFSELFRNGMAFLCEYNAQYYDTTQGRLHRQAELRARQGGPLGLEGVQEIIVGAKDVETAQQHWQQLFDPITPHSPGLWQIGDGPAIHLVPHTQDGLLTLIWKVASLQQARSFLNTQGMLGISTGQQLSLAPTKTFGLDIRLVE
jgi:hypothetical protein